MSELYKGAITELKIKLGSLSDLSTRSIVSSAELIEDSN